MSKWIDADNAIERLGAYLMTDAQIEYGGLASEDIDDWKPIAIDILKGAPSIDIVFCEDCRECVEKGVGVDCPSGYGYLYCRRKKSVVNEGDYCSWGEREGE